jgi:hypothetical protein
MQHQIDYINPYNRRKTLVSNLFVKGDNSLRTAMAKSVGYTMAVACRLVLEGKINLKGVHIPINREIYIPALAELAKLGFEFEEKEV